METAHSQIESSSEKLKNLNRQISSESEQLQRVQAELGDTLQQLEAAKHKVAVVREDGNIQLDKNEELIAEYTKLSVKITGIKQTIIDTQKNEKAVREDLAVRMRAADEREQNLKLRERKVAQVEGQVQANASLLDL